MVHCVVDAALAKHMFAFEPDRVDKGSMADSTHQVVVEYVDIIESSEINGVELGPLRWCV